MAESFGIGYEFSKMELYDYVIVGAGFAGAAPAGGAGAPSSAAARGPVECLSGYPNDNEIGTDSR